MPNNEYKGPPFFLAKAEMEIRMLRARDKKNLTQQPNSPDHSDPNQTQRQIEEHLRNLKNPRR